MILPGRILSRLRYIQFALMAMLGQVGEFRPDI